MEINKIEPNHSVSHWEKIGEIYICNGCKYYTEKAEGKCPRCGKTMISVVEIVRKNI